MSVLTASISPTTELVQGRKSFRINSIDLLRGLVMIIMAIDHSRDFLHFAAWSDNPLNLATTTPLLFFTRWITHFCAPVFVFLSGSSIYFQSLRKTKKELSLFLLKRGLWLIFVEVAIINLAFSFDFSYSIIGLQVIWAIGICMIILAAVIWMPFPVILATGLLIVLAHNSLDFYEATHKGNYDFLYSLLHYSGTYAIDQTHSLLILYPFLPWTGLMIIGYCFGKLFMQHEGAARKQMLLRLGMVLLAAFIALRAVNIYGNPEKWGLQKNAVYTVLSFIDVHKYPPSLLYMLLTISVGVLFLALAEGATNRLSKIITIYGRVPFLYYVLHFFLLHAIAAVLFFATGHSAADMKNISSDLPVYVLPGKGYSLLVVYAVWLFTVIMLYPVCKWFSNYKQTHRQWWLSYL